MQTHIQDYLGESKIGRKQSYKNLSVFPLLSPYSVSMDYLTLDEALAEEAIDIVEVDEGGSVPELKVINRGARKVLILDGEELVGAKQNRIVNTTILIKEKSATVIPVSCVERGRWAYDSRKFSSPGRGLAASIRACKSEDVADSLKRDRSFRSDQGRIWSEISEKASRLDAASPTMDIGSIYEKEAPRLEEYEKHFKLADKQVGAIFCINGRVAGMDCLGRSETFARVFKKLVHSYALDAIDWIDSMGAGKILTKDAENFLAEVRSAPVETNPSVQLGTDCRLETDRLIGSALEFDQEILHLAAFARDAEEAVERSTRMRRVSQRTRSRY